MDESVVIRELSETDWYAFNELDQIIFIGDEMDEEWYFKNIEQDGFFGLFIDNIYAGHLLLSRFGTDTGHLKRIGVAPKYQSRGFGNLLMEYALKWFKEQENINSIQLYTQEDNYPAQGLYKKYGFSISGTTWHHFVPYNSLIPQGKYTCQPIEEEEIDSVGDKYSEFPAAQIRRFLEDERFHVLTLKSTAGDVVGVCRFTPGYPGCFPFIIDVPDALDDFLIGLKPYSLPEFDYIRITYTDMPDVAKICYERRYKLHHKLFKFTRILPS